MPLRFADGYATTTQVVTFDGLVDGGEHLALGLGRWPGPAEPLVRLLTNNPDKAAQLERLGVTVTKQVPTGEYRGPANAAYLAAKAHHFTRSPVR